MGLVRRFGFAAMVMAAVILSAPAWAAPTVSVAKTLSANRSSTAAVTVNLSAPSSTAITVDYTTANRQATADVDYLTASGTLTFAPYETLKAITVPILSGAQYNSTFNVNISNAVGATIDNAQGTVTIVSAQFSPTFTLPSTLTATRATTLLVTVVRSYAANNTTATVSYATANGTARSDNDYQSASGTLRFSQFETSKTIALTILNNGNQSGATFFTMSLSSPSTGTIDNGTITITIPPPTGGISVPATVSTTRATTLQIPVTRSGTVTSSVDVSYTIIAGTAVAGADYSASQGHITFGANETAASIPVRILTNWGQPNPVTFIVHLSDPTAGATLTNSDAVVTVAPIAPLRVGAIFSSAQTGAQSFLRFFNTDSVTGTITVALSDTATGAVLGQWTTPNIAPGAELQYSIADVEAGANITTRPAYYSLQIQSRISGYFQHVLYSPADGTLTNLSTCAAGVTANPTYIAGAHSRLLGNLGFPSSISITNTGATTQQATVDIYDARTGANIGSYRTKSIPPGGQAITAVTAMEDEASILPLIGMYHYALKLRPEFTGYLQHLVNNQRAGVTTDMTTSCSLDGLSPTAASTSIVGGTIFSTLQPTSQSFLRFFNTGTDAGTVSVTLRDYLSGETFGTWTSPSIPALSEQQFDIGSVEVGARVSTRPLYYTIAIQSSFGGYFQHVLYRPADGTLTNLSTCAAEVTADSGALGGVHSAILGNLGFPSTIVFNNTGATAAAGVYDIYDARDGSRVGTYTTPTIAAGGQAVTRVADIEAATGLAPASGLYHYVLKARPGFTGFIQNLVNNTKVGVITDMSGACRLTAAAP